MSLLPMALSLLCSSNFLAASLQEGVRLESRALSPMPMSAEWSGSLELDPEFALVLGGGAQQLTAAYLPRLVVPSVAVSLSPELFHRVGMDARWSPSPGRVRLSTSQRFGYGTATRTAAGPPLAAGEAPELLPPVEHLRLFELSSRLAASLDCSRRLTLAGTAGIRASGGLDAASKESLPSLWGPEGELSLTWQATRRDALVLTAVGSEEWVSNSGRFEVVGGQPSWRRRLSRSGEARLGLGLAYVRFQPPLSHIASEKAGLLGLAEVAWHGLHSGWFGPPLEASLSVRTRPAVQRIAPRSEQLYEARGALGGDLSRGVGWSAGVSGAVATAPIGDADWLLAVEVGGTKRMGERTRIRAGLRASRERQVTVRPFSQVGLFVAFETSGPSDPAAVLTDPGGTDDDLGRSSHGQ